MSTFNCMQLSIILLLALSLIEATSKVPFTGWIPFQDEIPIPQVIDMRKGGSLKMKMTSLEHGWGSDLYGTVYGFSAQVVDVNGKIKKNVWTTASYPGPTILAARGVPFKIHWENEIPAPHILDENVEPSLLFGPSACYPKCGIPVVIHTHGLETPAQFDGLPLDVFYQGEVNTYSYFNNMSPRTLVYHDHAVGLTRLNVWAGLVGLYIIEDEKLERHLKVDFDFDVPIVIQDKIVSTLGELMYPTPECGGAIKPDTKWAPEAFGNVNLVNGVAMPYLNVPRQQSRLRLVNGANARFYNLSLPFYRSCLVIATEGGFVRSPKRLSSPFLSIYQLGRIELVCDFSLFPMGTVFNVTDDATGNVFQVRIDMKRKERYKPIPLELAPIKNLRDLWVDSDGAIRNITLNEVLDAQGCPTKLTLSYDNAISSFFQGNVIPCELGKVEKWNFFNPTADFHPFHWHLINFQCGPDEANINTNELHDTFPIPNSPTEDPNEIMQVCFVACTPTDYLIWGSYDGPTDFMFSPAHPFVIHCHILEHEENDMMTWFQVLAPSPRQNQKLQV